MNHQFMEFPESPGNRPRLNRPNESIAAPDSDVMEEQREAADTAQKAVTAARRNILEAMYPTGTVRGGSSRKPAASMETKRNDQEDTRLAEKPLTKDVPPPRLRQL